MKGEVWVEGEVEGEVGGGGRGEGNREGEVGGGGRGEGNREGEVGGWRERWGE